MCETNEPRICTKVCSKIGKIVTETYQLLQQAYIEDAMGHTQVFRQYKLGRTSVESDPRSGRPLNSRNYEMIAKIRTIVRNNKRLRVQVMAGDCGISVGSSDAILTFNLHMNRVRAKFQPLMLKDNQRKQRETIARHLIERSYEDLQFLKNIVTGDDSCGRTHHSAHWNCPTSPRQKKRRQVRSKTKVISLVFFFILRVT